MTLSEILIRRLVQLDFKYRRNSKREGKEKVVEMRYLWMLNLDMNQEQE